MHKTVRDQLAAAHASMTPAEIATHALDLADEIKRLQGIIFAQSESLIAAGKTAREFHTLAASMKATIGMIHDHYRAGRKKVARDLLATAAAIPAVVEPVITPRLEPLSDDIFQPKG